MGKPLKAMGDHANGTRIRRRCPAQSPRRNKRSDISTPIASPSMTTQSPSQVLKLPASSPIFNYTPYIALTNYGSDSIDPRAGWTGSATATGELLTTYGESADGTWIVVNNITGNWSLLLSRHPLDFSTAYLQPNLLRLDSPHLRRKCMRSLHRWTLMHSR